MHCDAHNQILNSFSVGYIMLLGLNLIQTKRYVRMYVCMYVCMYKQNAKSEKTIVKK